MKLTSPVWYDWPVSIRHLLSTDAQHFLFPLLFFRALTTVRLSVSVKQTTKGSKQRCFPCPESFRNWLYLFSACLSPLAAHWSTNIVQSRFSVLQLPQPYRSCRLDWTPESLQTNPPEALFFWYFHSFFLFLFRLSFCTRAEFSFHCALVLRSVMGYMLQYGETARKRVHYHYYFYHSSSPSSSSS